MGPNPPRAPGRSPLKEKRTTGQKVGGALRRTFSGGAVAVRPIGGLVRSGSQNVKIMLVRLLNVNDDVIRPSPLSLSATLYERRLPQMTVFVVRGSHQDAAHCVVMCLQKKLR